MNIAIFNGGRGAGTIIKSLMRFNNIKITSIINTLDDGKSTGEIRKIFNMFGPSDLRKVQCLYLEKNDLFYEENKNIFEYRFNLNSSSEMIHELNDFISKKNKINIFNLNIKDKKKIKFFKNYTLLFLKHLNKNSSANTNIGKWSFMNIVYAGCYFKNSKNILKTINEVKKLFNIKHDVYPSTNETCYLSAIRNSGKILYDEASIVEMRSNELINKIFISKKRIPKINSKKDFKSKIKYLDSHQYSPSLSNIVSKTLKCTDVIIYAPGTQYSSLFPTYLTKNVARVIANNKKCLKVFITNIGADYETPNFKASDYINLAFKYLNNNNFYNVSDLFSVNFVNKSNTKKKNYVKLDYNNLKSLNVPLLIRNFESKKIGVHNGDLIISLILNLYKNENSLRSSNLQ